MIPFLAALASGFLGGIILNFMPCVLPVISIKILSLVHQSENRPREIRRESLFTSAGIVASILTLWIIVFAMKSFGVAFGWGFQLQSPVFVMILALTFLFMALNLLGLFDFGTSISHLSGRLPSSGFFSGVVMTLSATPCSGPFMGSAINYAFTQDPVSGMLVFLSLGLGLALPYLWLAARPQSLPRLPKPGAWMDVLKKALAFPLLLTVWWLLNVLRHLVGPEFVFAALMGFIGIALTLWTYGRLQWKGRFSLLLLFLALVQGGYWSWAASKQTLSPSEQSSTDNEWVPYQEERIAKALSEGRLILLDFTAEWCVSCQVNKSVALDQPKVVRALNEAHVLLVRGDWTQNDERITKALESYGRHSIPFTLFLSPDSKEPYILPQVLTPDIVLNALEELITRKSAGKN